MPNESQSPEYAGTVVYLDKDFNLLRTRQLVHPGGNGHGMFLFDDMSVMRSNHNTTYLATRSNRFYDPNYDDCFLYEYDDDIEGTEVIVPTIHDTYRGIRNFDFVAECRAVEVGDDNSIYFCYTLNVGFLYSDSWVVIERLDENFNTIQEVYYGIDSDLHNYCAESIMLARDGGIFLSLYYRQLDYMSHWGSTTMKFSAEVFVGIEEAHDNGLKVAIAYPNPGKDVLNIRTGLKDARVEVYDMNSRLVHSQALTENVTPIDATDWAEGVYVWKVYTSNDGPSTGSATLAETGKWVKE